jgi:hypothetical protein
MKIHEVITATRGLAKSFRRKINRINPPGVFGPRNRVWRKPSAPDIKTLLQLLSSFEKTFIFVQGRAEPRAKQPPGRAIRSIEQTLL